jgi:ABC-type nitrate/sulfonate/bicarbonate transport system substrate-binding protein
MRRAVLTALALAALAVAGCGEDDDGNGGGGGGGDSGGEPVSLSIGIDSVYAPMFLAQEQGIFEDHGLNVEVKQFAQGGEGMDAMVAGSIDVAGSADSTVLARAGRTDLRALGLFVEDKGNYVKLVTREDIDDPSQIKTMGVVPGSISEYGAFKLLRTEGIDEGSVKMVDAGPPEMPALLQNGDIDAFVMWEPWPTRAEEMGGKVLMKSSEFDLSYVLVVAAQKEWLDSHKEQATALMDALAEAADKVEEDPGAAADAAGAQAKLPPEQVEQAIADLDFGVRPFEQRDRRTWNEIADFLVERDLVPDRPPVEEVLSEGVAGGG